MIGDKFNRLIVLEKYYKHNRLYYKCLCDCGNICYIRGDSIKSGHIKSCGCLHKEVSSKLGLKSVIHGKTNTRLYNIYRGIKQRCYNKNNQAYVNYGERGIKMCDEWRNDFITFYNWSMNNGYNDDLTIDRIDVDGNYEPSNCRWVTKSVQNNNTRKTIYLAYSGKFQTFTQWAKELNVNRNTIRQRYYRGYSDKECLLGKER